MAQIFYEWTRHNKGKIEITDGTKAKLTIPMHGKKSFAAIHEKVEQEKAS